MNHISTMHTIGILGGIASGKSTVAAELARLGARVLDADQATYQVFGESEVKEALVEKWGPSVLDPAGAVDRQRLAELVFGDGEDAQQNRQYLEALLHPRIRSRIELERDEIIASGQAPAMVLDAPLLLEAGWDTMCDSLLFVDCPLEKRQLRATARGWSNANFSRREAAQMPIKKKRQRATHVLVNTGTEADLRESIARIWTDLTGGDRP